MKKHLFLLLGLTVLLLGPVGLKAELAPPRSSISEKSWEAVFPYLLPEDAEIKPKLDAFFQNGSIIRNSDTLKAAGFTNHKPREFSRIVVTTHPDFQGYVFKIYLDDELEKPDIKALHFFLKRVRGAIATQNFIEENDLQDLFKVPKKWIYLLPERAKHHKKSSRKNFILVEEDMNILSKEANKQAWKSEKVTEAILFGLYRILKEVGLVDCAKIDNIPFSHDGKVAFIDTESYGYETLPLKRLKKYLTSKMRHFWLDLVSHK